MSFFSQDCYYSLHSRKDVILQKCFGVDDENGYDHDEAADNGDSQPQNKPTWMVYRRQKNIQKWKILKAKTIEQRIKEVGVWSCSR